MIAAHLSRSCRGAQSQSFGFQSWYHHHSPSVGEAATVSFKSAQTIPSPARQRAAKKNGGRAFSAHQSNACEDRGEARTLRSRSHAAATAEEGSPGRRVAPLLQRRERGPPGRHWRAARQSGGAARIRCAARRRDRRPRRRRHGCRCRGGAQARNRRGVGTEHARFSRASTASR